MEVKIGPKVGRGLGREAGWKSESKSPVFKLEAASPFVNFTTSSYEMPVAGEAQAGTTPSRAVTATKTIKRIIEPTLRAKPCVEKRAIPLGRSIPRRYA